MGGKNKLSLFRDDRFVNVENLKNQPKKTLKLISDHSKVAKYNVNVLKSISFLYTSNDQVEFEIKNTISFILAHPKNKTLGNKSNNIYIYNLYEESYQTLMKDIKELNKRKDIPCSWMGRLNIVKMLVLYNLICEFSTIPIKIPANNFADINCF